MKVKQFNINILCLVLSAIATIGFTLKMQMDPGRGNLVNYSFLQTGIILLLTLFALVAIGLLLVVNFKPDLKQRFLSQLDELFSRDEKRLRNSRIAFAVLGVFFFECFLVSYIALPVPLRPTFLWLTFLAFLTLFLLFVTYRHKFPVQPNLLQRFHSKWNQWTAHQRNVALVLLIIGIVYFIAFIPINMFPDQWGVFHPQDDEKVLYPDITRVLVLKGSFSEEVRTLVGKWNWQWGYPYLITSASVLVIPRLIFGSQFAEHVSLNIGLLRQFISVLPMIIAIGLSVYLVTKFRSRLLSIGMFVFMLLVPGIFRNNQEYWHPDSMIILLIILTIYFLKKDELRFRGYFYLAAVACGLATALKLWGVFFFFVILGYLAAGYFGRQIPVKKLVSHGILFLLTMMGAILLSSPSLMAPYMVKTALKVWQNQQADLVYGPSTVGAEFYEKDLFLWLKTFGIHYMKPFFFYFTMVSLTVLSFIGSKKYLSRILVGWCLPATIFLVYVVAMKNFQYTLQVGVPLNMGAFILPAAMMQHTAWKPSILFEKTWMRKMTWGVLIALFASQFVINLVLIAMPLISNYLPELYKFAHLLEV